MASCRAHIAICAFELLHTAKRISEKDTKAKTEKKERERKRERRGGGDKGSPKGILSLYFVSSFLNLQAAV